MCIPVPGNPVQVDGLICVAKALCGSRNRIRFATFIAAALLCVAAPTAGAQVPVITQQPTDATANTLGTGSVVASSGGYGHTLFLMDDGTLWAMGGNDSGQLGDGTTTNRITPVKVSSGVASVAAGESHSLFVKTDGTLWAMGYNWYGQLGDGTTTSRLTPVQVATGVASAAARGYYSLFVKTDGTLWAMGSNASNYIGYGTAPQFGPTVQVATGVLSVSAGSSHSLFVKDDGTLWAMGYNGAGQLGDGTTIQRSTPVQVATGVASASAAGSHSLFVKTDGTLWAMGNNVWGQLGDGTTTHRITPVQVASGVALATGGGSHSLFVKTDGTLLSMGWNHYGQLGDGTKTDRSTPVQVASEVASVAAGDDHSLFVKADGSLWSMGFNHYGQLGDGTNFNNRTPPIRVGAVTFSVTATGTAPLSYQWKKDGVNIAGATSATYTIASPQMADESSYTVAVANAFGSATSKAATLTVNVPPSITTHPASQTVSSPGQNATFSVAASGTAPLTYQWRKGDDDIPGAVSASYQIFGVEVSHADDYTVRVGNDGGVALSNAVTLTVNLPPSITVQPSGAVANTLGNGSVGASAGGFHHTLFLADDGTLWAMGNNSYGQLGDETTTQRDAPVHVASGVASMGAGGNHSLFAKTDGTLWAMGANWFGQHGDGTTTNPSTPVQVATGVASVAAGDYHSLFVKTDGTLWAMGNNSAGQLGDETTTQRNSPVQVATGVASVAAGDYHSLFVKTDGTLWAMGNNSYGQLGDGTWTSRNTPVQTADDVAFVAAGGFFSLFVKTDGSLWAMGDNYFGQLGDASTTDRGTPVQVASEVASMAAGQYHSLFVKTDGTLWAMGDNSAGQLGDGSTTSSNTPVQAANEVTSVAAGDSHSLFVKTDATLWAMGSNGSGQLGDGTTTDRILPIRVGAVTLSAAAIGPGPLAYQWKKDGVDIAGATSATFYIANPQASDTGIYTVVVTNAFGSTTSNAATLIIVNAESPPVIISHPANRTLIIGGSASFSVAAAGTGPLTYQWQKDGADIVGANASSYSLSNAQIADAGSYTVVVSNAYGSTTSSAATLTLPRLVNLSARARAGAGGNTLVVGFYIAGTGSKTVLIRGVGPKLADYDVQNVVADLALKLYSGEDVIAENDDWDASLATDFVTAGAFALDPGSKDAAMKFTLGPGAYTIHVINPGAVAEALVEVYDLSQDVGTRFVNLSCRMSIEAGQIVIVGTFVTGEVNVVARNVGVGLTSYLLPEDQPFALPDPLLRFYSGQTVIAENDDWDAALAPWFEAVGAFELPAGSKDAAYRLPVGPGGYTIHASGNGPGGILLVELYESN